MAKKFIAVQLSGGMGQDKTEGINAISRSVRFSLVQGPETAFIDPIPDTVLHLSLPHSILNPRRVAIFTNHLQCDEGLSLSQKESE